MIAIVLAAALAQAASAAPSNWAVSDQKSELDGASTYLAYVGAKQSIAVTSGREKTPTLDVICDREGFRVFFNWHDKVDEDAVVTWKLDDGPVTRTRFDGLKTTAALFGNEGLGWLKRLAGGRRLVARVPDAHAGQEASFDLTGIDAVIATVSSRNCG
jgi:hypothetical protein